MGGHPITKARRLAALDSRTATAIPQGVRLACKLMLLVALRACGDDSNGDPPDGDNTRIQPDPNTKMCPLFP